MITVSEGSLPCFEGRLSPHRQDALQVHFPRIEGWRGFESVMFLVVMILLFPLPFFTVGTSSPLPFAELEAVGRMKLKLFLVARGAGFTAWTGLGLLDVRLRRGGL